jgi:hypothetical protein
MSKVIRLEASANFTVEQALQDTLHRELQDVLIIGYDKEGMFFTRSSKMGLKDALWLVKLAEQHIFESNR